MFAERITSIHVAYYHLCHRKLWLFHHQIRMENASGNVHVAEGKLIEDSSYTRRAQRWRQLLVGNLRIDHFDPVARVVREVKKSPKLEHAHVAQLKYYLFVLARAGVKDLWGELEYPRQRRRVEVRLTAEDGPAIEDWERDIERIVASPVCPALRKKAYCKACAFYDFCYV